MEVARRIEGMEAAQKEGWASSFRQSHGGGAKRQLGAEGSLVLAPTAPLAMAAPGSPPLLSSEHEVLIALYYDGDGPFWVDKTASESWLNHHYPPCKWKGVSCSALTLANGTTVSTVTELDMTGFGMRALSPRISGLGNLVKLRVLSNRLRSLPESIGSLQDLKFFNAGFNHLASLPSTLGNLTGLVKLWLHENSLESIPESIGRLVNLEHVLLFGNKLRSLPEAVGGLASLRILSLERNLIEFLPDGLMHLANLHDLFLPKNRLGSIPDSIGRLQNLRWLNLDDNLLESLPASIGNLTSLLGLSVSGNQLRALPDTAGQLRRLRELEVAGNLLEKLPDSICRLADLERLDAVDNRLRVLPEAVGELRSLVTLSLAKNQIESLPESVGQLQGLSELILSSNRLAAVPRTIGNLTSVTLLQLENNQLLSLPESVGDLVRLERLHLFNNPLAVSLPDLSRLGYLKELLVSHTLLTALPALPLKTLVRIDINNNRLSGRLNLCGPNLRTLNINDNPALAGLYADVFEKCLPSLTSMNAARCNLTSVNYLRDSRNLTDLDVSQNGDLGTNPLALAASGAWPGLLSLRADSTGIDMSVAEVFGSLFGAKSLLALDISGNPLIYGSLSAASFEEAGIVDGDAPVVLPLLLLRMSGTQVDRFEANMEGLFANVRILALGDSALLHPETPVDMQVWLHLEQVDVRGAGPRVGFAAPAPFPGAPYAVDVVSNTSSLCPTALIGGTVSRFSILADPKAYNWTLCRCLDGYFGEPWNGGCLPCPDAPRGETGVSVDCSSRPGVMNVTGGWLRFGSGGVEVVACPSDSLRSPCAWGALGLSVRSRSEWDRRVGGGANSTACREGYEGRLCSRCRAGFFRSGRTCHRCGVAGLSWLNPILSFVVLTVLGLKSVTGGFSSRSGLIRTLTLHAQLVALLPDLSLRMTDWSGFFIKASASGAGGLRLNGLECEGRVGWDGFFGPFVLASLLPVVVVAGGAWISLLSGLPAVARGRAASDRFKTAAFYLWLVLLFGSIKHLMAPLNCTRYGESEGGGWYLTSALWVACEGRSFDGLVAAGVVLGMGYTLGTIGLVAYRLRPASQGTSSISAYLRSPYSPESYYWEAVQLIRRVALAMTGALTKLNSPLQPVIVTAVLILSLLAHTWRKPYARATDNSVESASLTLLLSSYMAGLVGSNPRFPPSATSAISWLFFALNAMFLALLLAAVLFRSARSGIHTITKRYLPDHNDEGSELNSELLSRDLGQREGF